jgi:CRP/FNR family cyclic AMP-dependent transcriptional regulator
VDPKVERLAALRAFSGLSKSDLKKLAAITAELDVPAGEELTKQGRFAHEFFVIEDGSVEVRQDGERIAELGPGDFFGEIALIAAERRTATVVATTPLRIVVMSTQEFRRMEREMPLVADRIRSAITARLDSDAGG